MSANNGNFQAEFRIKPIDIYLEPAIDSARHAAEDKAQDIADQHLGPDSDELYDNFTDGEIDEIVAAFEGRLEDMLS